MSNTNKNTHQRVGFVEDDPVYRAYFTSLLKSVAKVSLVDIWESAEAMMADKRGLAVELLFIDLDLPGISGLELISRLHNLPNFPCCVVLTSSLDPEHVFSAMRVGASGYLLKTLDPQGFLENLNQVIKDGVSLSPLIARMLIDEFRHSPHPPGSKNHALKELTARERQVIESLARHGCAKGIAEALGLSHETVRVHMKKIYQKLHVNSKSEALAVLAQERKS